jgi:glycosyltransferase involved in cell wall biosynthesis
MKNKISVIIICYNQEDVVGRAIDSVLVQKEFLHELIISDDCSGDGTWAVITEYAATYPDKVKPHRNELNQGMYENLQNAYKYVTGNLILFLSGDDAFGIELFSKIDNLVSEKSLNPDIDKFTIITDFSIKYPEGKEIVNTNNKIISRYNPFSLKLRGLVVGRAMCESQSVFLSRKSRYISRQKGNKFPSSLQEGYTDAFAFAFSDKIFHLPYVGNIYYADIGHLKKIDHKKRERLSRYENYAKDFIEIFSSKLTKYDIRFLQHEDSKFRYLDRPNLRTWLNYLKSVLGLVYDPYSSMILKTRLKFFAKITFFPNKF